MTLSGSWLRVHPARLTFRSFLWLLCGLPLFQIVLFPSIQEQLRTPFGFAIQALRPLSSFGALVVLAYVARRQQGRRRWTWRCDMVVLLLNLIFSVDRIIVGTAEPTPLTTILPVLIYLFALVGTALYIEPHAWLLGSTARALLDGIVVGYSSLILLHWSLPLLLHYWPWNPQVGIVMPYPALDMGILFAVGAGGLRSGRGNRPFVIFILLSLLCLLIADTFYVILAWMPWGRGEHWLLQPLFSLQVILLAFAAYYDVCSPTTRPVQAESMSLGEWLFWALVPEFFLFSAFFVGRSSAIVSPLMLSILFGIAVLHAFFAQHDYRRVLRNLSLAQEEVRQTNSALIAANSDLEAANRSFEQANHDLALAHAAAQTAAQTTEAFLARLVHDLAPPVQGLTSVIMGSSWPADQQADHAIAQRQLRFLENFIHQARTYLQARSVSLECAVVPLLPLCRTALSTVASRTQQRDIRLMQEIEVESPMVWGDETAILRILDNLLTNALGVTPEGGTITLRVTTPAPGWVEIAIVDHGPGISTARQAMLFQPYHAIQPNTLTPSPTGTGLGLGLAIVHELTCALGGKCGVESQPGVGSTFFVRLACEAPHYVPAEA